MICGFQERTIPQTRGARLGCFASYRRSWGITWSLRSMGGGCAGSLSCPRHFQDARLLERYRSQHENGEYGKFHEKHGALGRGTRFSFHPRALDVLVVLGFTNLLNNNSTGPVKAT